MELYINNVQETITDLEKTQGKLSKHDKVSSSILQLKALFSAFFCFFNQ